MSEGREAWWFLASGPTDPASNMAMDEALLEASRRLGRPVLRVYSWTRPAATFGYFQHHAEIAGWTSLRPLLRRPTGGGLVPHDADWTYSLAVPPGHAWHGLPAVESYQRVHQWLQAAFARHGVPTALAPCCDPRGPGQCFVGAERFDLLWTGRKIAGAAQRRNRNGLLIQGSIQAPPSGLRRSDWESAMLEVAGASSGVTWDALIPDPSLVARCEELVATKYSRAEYHEKR